MKRAYEGGGGVPITKYGTSVNGASGADRAVIDEAAAVTMYS